MTLQTVTPKHQDFQEILIYVPYRLTVSDAGPDIGLAIGEEMFGQWSDLDRLLVQLWESHSIRPKIVCPPRVRGEQETRDSVRYLLPEITKGGIIHLVEVEQATPYRTRY
jgi:hypothetical protein